MTAGALRLLKLHLWGLLAFGWGSLNTWTRRSEEGAELGCGCTVAAEEREVTRTKC